MLCGRQMIGKKKQDINIYINPKKEKSYYQVSTINATFILTSIKQVKKK